MTPLKALIFDMDGTLADTEEVHRQAFNQAFEEFALGWHWSQEDYKRLLLISGGKERIHYCLQQAPSSTVKLDTTLQFANTIHKRKSEIYREKLVNGKIPLRDGVKRLINDARDNNISLAIATSSSRKNVETLLKSNLGPDALSWFQAIVTCDKVEDKKPSPAAYEYALAQLQLSAADCIVIEDTCNGHQAAMKAGLATVITTHEYTEDDDFTGACLVLDHLGEKDKPCHVQQGDIHGCRYVDMALLRQLHTEYQSCMDSENRLLAVNT